MQIICPNCQQDHEVPEDRLRTAPDKATMQCARCKTLFPLSSQTGVAPRRRRVSHNRLLLGILAAIGVALALVLLAYIAAQNKGVLELDRLPEQVKIALGQVEDRGEPGQLEISLKEGYKLVIKDGNPILVVKGEVSNPGPDRRTHIILEGRIVDSAGKTLFMTRSPCGRVFANKRLKKTRRGAFSRLFARGKEMASCHLDAGKKKPFQMIFDDIPPDYDESYTVQVKTLFSGRESLD